MLIEVEREIRCRSQVTALWEVLTDTERLNRAVGMDRVVYRPNTDASAARFIGTTNLGGFEVEYEERPSEWVFGQHFRITRYMRSGPVERLETIFKFDALPGAGEGGATVKIRLVFWAKLALMAPIIKMRAKKSLERFEQEISRIDAALASHQEVRSAASASVRINEQPFSQAAALLRARAPGDCAERLLRLVREADDVEVMRLRPFVLAELWGVPRIEMLSVMLQAVQCGLLDLRWELVCPSCRVAADVVPTLAELREHGACQLCEIDFALDVDEALEVTFSPSRALRAVDAGPFCIAGPAKVPHVMAQIVVPAQGIGTLVAPQEPGRYRLFLRGGQRAWVEVAAGERAVFSVPADALSARGEHVLRVAPGGVLLVANPTGEERHAKLERGGSTHQAATAREVTALAAFRQTFSSDVLKPGASLKVSRVSLFFSDLTASTQLYSTVGDAAAFRLVQDHFDVVLACIERHHGALVKTIGDAVMAVFADEADGLRASMEILQRFELFRAEQPDRMRTHIKLGLFSGPCYVVTANGVLDYFGQTVNIAARLQAQADSGELVVTAELAERALSQGLASGAVLRERYEARLKGIDAPMQVARLIAAQG